MKPSELKERVDSIIAVAYDNEVAHSEEDKLYAELLDEYLPSKLLAEVIRLRKAEFARWCA